MTTFRRVAPPDAPSFSSHSLTSHCYGYRPSRAQPADTKSWIAAAQLESQAPVVVLNGFQYNGYKAFEMAYYLYLPAQSCPPL